MGAVFNTEKTYRQGSTIITQGVLSTSVYQLVNGTCDVIVNENIIATIGAGETFGELGFLLCTVTSASVVVSSSCATVAECSWDALCALYTKSPSCGACFYRQLAASLSARFLKSEAHLVRRDSVVSDDI